MNEIAKINEFNQPFSVVQVTILFFKTFYDRLNVTNCSKPIFFVCVCGRGVTGLQFGGTGGHKRGADEHQRGTRGVGGRDNSGHKECRTWTPESRRGYR